MTEASSNTVVITAIIAAAPPMLIATAALITSLRNGKKVEQLHVTVNSKMSEFVKLIETSSEAKGVLKEHQRKKLEDIHFAEGRQAEKDKCP